MDGIVNVRCSEPGAHGAHVWQYRESSNPCAFQALCDGMALSPNIAIISTEPNVEEPIDDDGSDD